MMMIVVTVVMVIVVMVIVVMVIVVMVMVVTVIVVMVIVMMVIAVTVIVVMVVPKAHLIFEENFICRDKYVELQSPILMCPLKLLNLCRNRQEEQLESYDYNTIVLLTIVFDL